MKDKGIRLMVLELPKTLSELPGDSSIATMIMETINNMLIEMYASFAQAELEKKEKRQGVNGMIMEYQELQALINSVRNIREFLMEISNHLNV